MDPDMQAMLTARFIAAIKASFERCPLIGPKWFRFDQAARGADMLFTGVGKLAKALGIGPREVAELLVKNLDFKGTQARVRVSRRCDTISVYLQEPANAGQT